MQSVQCYLRDEEDQGRALLVEDEGMVRYEGRSLAYGKMKEGHC